MLPHSPPCTCPCSERAGVAPGRGATSGGPCRCTCPLRAHGDTCTFARLWWQMIPIGSVDRIMKEALFKGCTLPQGSTALMQACLSKFITRLTTVRFHCEVCLSFACPAHVRVLRLRPACRLLTHACSAVRCIAQGALEKCGRENRKSITADDLVWTLKLSSEFNHYAPIARAYTQRHRAIEATSRLSKRQGQSRSPLARLQILFMWPGSASKGCLANLCPAWLRRPVSQLQPNPPHLCRCSASYVREHHARAPANKYGAR